MLDLGSGGGIDVLLSARRVAPGGKAYGLDGSPDMIALARENAATAGVKNAEFLPGRIEAIPLPEASVDVVISNCVINLSADKPRVLAETFRVLRPGGRIGISDIIADQDLDPARRAEAERLTGCAAGTLTAAGYRRHLLAAGFTTISITATSEPAPGLHSAIIQATRPAAPAGGLIRPMTPRRRRRGPGHLPAGLDAGHASFETPPRTGTPSTAPACRSTGTSRPPAPERSSAGPPPPAGLPTGALPRRHRALPLHPPRRRGRGIGAALLAALIGSSEAAGIWTIQTGIFPENTPSLVSPASRVPRRRHPPPHRQPSRPLARRHPPRTPQHHHRNLTNCRAAAVAWGDARSCDPPERAASTTLHLSPGSCS